MVLYELGFSAISGVSETVEINAELMQQLKSKYKHIIFFMDSDEVGRESNMRAAIKHKCKSILIPEFYNIKDISDFISIHKKQKTFKLLKKLLREAFRKRIHDEIPF